MDQQLLPRAQKGITLISEETRKIIDWQQPCPGVRNKHWPCLRLSDPFNAGTCRGAQEKSCVQAQQGGLNT